MADRSPLIDGSICMIILHHAEASEPGVPRTEKSTATGAVSDLRKHVQRVPPGRSEYRIAHNIGTEDVIVQTRIAGRIREGGVSIVDANTVGLVFGGVLNEPLDVVVIG